MLTVLTNPLAMLSVKEAGGPGGCASRRLQTVQETAALHHCEVAVNAGFFVPKGANLGACLGNVVTDGTVVQHSIRQNVNFGVRADGSVFIGYLPVPPPPPTTTTTTTPAPTTPSVAETDMNVTVVPPDELSSSTTAAPATNQTLSPRADKVTIDVPPSNASASPTTTGASLVNTTTIAPSSSTTTTTTSSTPPTTTTLPPPVLTGGNSSVPFVQLIAGVLWLIKVPSPRLGESSVAVAPTND